MLATDAAAQVRAMEDRVRRFRFRSAQSYLEDMSTLADELKCLGRDLEGFRGEIRPAIPVVAVEKAADGKPGYAPAAIISGRNQVLVSFARRASPAPRSVAR